MSITRNIAKRALGTVAVVALFAGTTLITPQDGNLSFDGQPAMAAPGGNGNGNGNGGTNGNGGNSGNAGSSAGGNAGSDGSNGGEAGAEGDADGNPGQGHAFGRNKDDDGEAHASDLGRLNAAHASETARENAAPTSAVGQLASYEGNVTGGDLESAASDFAEAANKSVVEPVVHAVNELLGIDDSPVGSDDDQATDGDDGEGEGDVADGEVEGDTDGDGQVTVHDTEAEITARANGTFDPADDGDTAAPEGARDS